MNSSQKKLANNLSSNFKIKLYLLFKVPLAFFAGIRVKSINLEHSKVSIQYKWITTNPFKSMYFAAQAMAAEFATGSLAMLHTKGYSESIAMLIVKMNSSYNKKATGKITFECIEGENLKNTLNKCIEQNLPQTCICKAVGIDEKGDIVSEFEFTWSFKKR